MQEMAGTVGPPLPCTAFRLEAVPEMNYDPGAQLCTITFGISLDLFILNLKGYKYSCQHWRTVECHETLSCQGEGQNAVV